MTEKKPLILAVDDNPRNLAILEEIISEYFEFEMVTSGEEAIEAVKKNTPDIILLDIMMSGIDGYETCKQIKDMQDIIHPKIIFVSGKAMEEERIKGYEVGGDDYLTKPFNDEELLSKVNVFLRLISVEKKLRSLNLSLEEQVKVRTEQLVKSEQMAFLGMHMAEIVHNLKSPLTVIKASADRLKKQYPEDKSITRINNGYEKLYQIIKTILRPEVNQDQVVNINDVINNEIDLLNANVFFSNQVTKNINLSDIPPIHGDYTHFSQSLGNLITNAIDSMFSSDKKELSISTRKNEKSIIVEIEDSGQGITPDNLKKIFDPFFTTKPINASEEGEPTGTGLGLPSCKKMIESYGGEVIVDSEVGRGTKFTASFPINRRND